MSDSLDLTSPAYWNRVLADPGSHGFAADHARSLAEHFTGPQKDIGAADTTTDGAMHQPNADFHIGCFGAQFVRVWLGLRVVSPRDAALLLHDENPSRYKGTLPEMGENFDQMLLVFEDVGTDRSPRNLHEWLSLAQERALDGSGVAGWAACSKIHLAKLSLDDALAPADTEAPVTPSETPWHLLGTPAELIAAFGASTGMQKTWFNKPEGQLKAARDTVGIGGRNGREPLYAVFTVMQWLIDPKRRAGKPIDVATGWRILKNQFPKVYEAYQTLGPGADSPG